MTLRPLRKMSTVLISFALVACGDTDESPLPEPQPDAVADPDGAVESSPAAYSFVDEEGASTVAHFGQTARQALILEMKSWVGGLTADVDAAVFMPETAEEVVDEFAFFMDFDSDSDGDTPVTLSVHEGLELHEKTIGELNTGTNLQDKVAGNDTKTDHKDWATEFAGWQGVTSPDELLDTWFTMVGDNAVKRANGELDWDVHLTAEGHDLQQLIQKFLTMAITFHQGTDDYLDSDVEGKGLLASNTVADGKNYTGLAHAWDEGFGYFGAAKNYDEYTDDEIAGKGGRDDWQGHYDTNGDGKIQLKDEYCWAASLNAAKRDRGASDAAPTDMTGDVFSAFVAGRELIASIEGELSAEQMTELEGYRDTIVWGWETAYAATALHYINDTLRDMALIGTDAYDFATHAKHWSEMKGFSLGLQFSPRSPLSDADFVAFHDKVGDAPVLEGGDLDAYETALIEAREILAAAYGFASENVGDENGENGW